MATTKNKSVSFTEHANGHWTLRLPHAVMRLVVSSIRLEADCFTCETDEEAEAVEALLSEIEAKW